MMRGFATFWSKHRILAAQRGATSYFARQMYHITASNALFDKQPLV
jgi:hypothetical protein